jgi:outer membrane protein assembly factor BamB
MRLTESRPTGARTIREAFLGGLAVVALLSFAGRLDAYTFRRVGVDSNLAIDGSRVIFAQGTGSLTVLDLETGAVLLRKKPDKTFSYSGRLQSTAHGVLMMTYDQLILLDRNSFDPIWQAGHCYGSVVDGEYVVSHDGNQTVNCRKIRSGELCWSVEMVGGWRLLTANGKVLIAATDVLDGQSALLVIDLASGQKLSHQEAPPGNRWREAYFDGALVYLAVDKSAEWRSFSSNPDKLIALNLKGETVTSVDYNSPAVQPKSPARWNGSFIWRDKLFNANGRVQPVTASEQTAIVETWRQARRDEGYMLEMFFELLPSGVIASVPSQDATRKFGQLLQMSSAAGSWRAYARQLAPYGSVSQVSEGGGRLLVGDTEGHVECLDIKTGRPRWLYAFPAVNQTVSYSTPYGMPPYLMDATRMYRQGIAKLSESRGSIPVPPESDPATATWSEVLNSTNYAGQIVVDPEPDDPFAAVDRYLWYVIGFALLPLIGGCILLARFARKRARDEAAAPPSVTRKRASISLVVWCLALSISPAVGILFFGRVSYPWTLALKIIFALAILGAAIGMVRIFVFKRWRAAAVSAVILIIWCLVMSSPWRFA